MKLTKKSKLLMSFFMKNNCVPHISQTKYVDEILKELYNEFIDAHNYLINLKKHIFYNINIKKITHISQISRPKNFNSNSFPEDIRNHIDNLSLTEISYTFSLFDRKITIHFIVEEAVEEHNLDIYNRYVDTIILWFYILNEYGSKKCSSTFTIFLYFTSLEKSLPNSNIDIYNSTNFELLNTLIGNF